MADIKQAAAMAAVVQYLKTQEEAMALLQSQTAAVGAPEAETAAVRFPAVNYWGLSGRQEQMHIRSMVQMKAFHGHGSR